jgi:hypothetical protein
LKELIHLIKHRQFPFSLNDHSSSDLTHQV